MNRILFCCAFAVVACGGPGGRGPELGALSVDITQAPSDASCISLTVSGGNRQATRLEQALAPGVSTVFTLNGLPTGAVLVTAFAAPGNCQAAPTWLADPVSTTIPAGGVASLTLVLHRNGQAAVVVDFQDDIKTVGTLAGSAGKAGAADGIGPAARFTGPSGVWADGAGNLFVADPYTCTIRQVVIATGAVTTIAGSGVCSRVDGTGRAAGFAAPDAITGDGAGNLYVAEPCSIRRVTVPAAAVTTLAGGTCGAAADGVGPAARFLFLTSVATDGASLFLSDSNDCTIRKLNLSSGAVTTIAGAHGVCALTDGAANVGRLSGPDGLALDAGRGLLYFGDFLAVRRLTLSTGALVTLAGVAGVQGARDGIGTGALFFQVAGLALDGAGNVFVSDSTLIRKLYAQTGAVVTIAGTPGGGYADGSGAGAQFAFVQGLAVNPSNGALFVADTSNSIIRNLQ